MNLVYYPSEILTTKVKDVDLTNPGFNPRELRAMMVDTMLSNNGIGLSANQVNINLSKGWNLLLVKSLQSSGIWQFASVISDLEGNPIEELKYR